MHAKRGMVRFSRFRARHACALLLYLCGTIYWLTDRFLHSEIYEELHVSVEDRLYLYEGRTYEEDTPRQKRESSYIKDPKVYINESTMIKNLIKTDKNGSSQVVSCSKWIYDVADWTLTYKEEKFESINSCPKPGNVKKIIHSNSTPQFTGCTKKTKKCNETAHFNYNLGIRINTPPCCRSHVIEIFRHFTHELQILGVDHQLTFGGVIGWYRDKKMIPYDGDLDVLVSEAFWKSKRLDSLLELLKRKYGHESEMVEEHKLQIRYSDINKNCIDVWPMRERYLKYTGLQVVKIDHFYWRMQPRHNLLPSRVGIFEGIRTYIPSEPVHFLDRAYGKDKWRKPLDCKHVNSDGSCISKPP